MTTWRTALSREDLQARALILKKIRDFFASRDVIEVDTPLLCSTVNTDPYIQAFSCEGNSRTQYLQTSPEFAMKRLLASGSGSIYQICKAFRQDPSARLHNPEFTILEWYRLGFDHHQLMDEVAELLQVILSVSHVQRISYQTLFVTYAGFDPFIASLEEIQECAKKQVNMVADDLTRDDWLDIVMTHIIEPQLVGQFIFVYDFPPSQAALSRIRPGAMPVAERFELYGHGIELANGFHELTDAKEQHERFLQDNQKRARLGLPQLPIDEDLLAALRSGLPPCAGVALGVDRLVMLALGAKSLAEVINFI